MSRPLITVKTLRALARENGRIELPADALITPAAADWLQTCRAPVQTAEAQDQSTKRARTIYVVGDARHHVVQTLLPILERGHAGLEFLPCNGHLAGCLEAVREMCEGLAECSGRRGIALLEDGAIVNCVANKHPHVRAAIASKPSTLFGLVRRLGINLLILEFGRWSLRQMQASIDEFLTGNTSIDPIVEAALKRLPIAVEEAETKSCSGGA